MAEGAVQRFNTRTPSTVLSKMGWTHCGRVRWKGDLHTFYCKGPKPAHPQLLADELERQREAKEVEGDFAD